MRNRRHFSEDVLTILFGVALVISASALVILALHSG